MSENQDNHDEHQRAVALADVTLAVHHHGESAALRALVAYELAGGNSLRLMVDAFRRIDDLGIRHYGGDWPELLSWTRRELSFPDQDTDGDGDDGG